MTILTIDVIVIYGLLAYGGRRAAARALEARSQGGAPELSNAVNRAQRRRRSRRSRGEWTRPRGASRSSCATSVISAFHSAQPRPRDHVPARRRGGTEPVAGSDPDRNVQAMTVSQAGSPTPDEPKSSTAASRPSRTSRFPVATSPWNHTGSRSHGGHRVGPHALDVLGPDLLAERLDRLEGLAFVVASGPPRKSCARRAAARPSRRLGPVRSGTRPRRGEAGEVADGGLRSEVALQPAVHRPRSRGSRRRAYLVPPVSGSAAGAAARAPQPPLLLVDLLGVPVPAREPDGQLRAAAGTSG